MDDRRTVRGSLLCGVSIELVVEDGTDRSVGERADLDGARRGGLQTCDAERSHQPQDAETGSEALLGVRSLLQDEIAERRGCRADECGIPADAADGPVGVTAMTGGHVVGDGGVLAVAASSHVHGDPLAPDEDLHAAASQPHLDLAAREAVGHAVEVALDIDVIVDADTAHAPFGEDVGLGRQGLERRPIELFEQLPTREAEPADRPLLVEPLEQLADCRVQLCEAVEPAITQPTEEPTLDDQHASFDLGLVGGRRGLVGSTAAP